MRLILIRHGESDHALRNVIAGRVSATLERLARRFAGQTVVAVTHAGFIVASVLVLFDIPRPGTGARLDPGSTSLTEWRVAQARWRLVRFNDTSHVIGGDTYDG